MKFFFIIIFIIIMKLAIVGSRNFTDYNVVKKYIEKTLKKWDKNVDLVISGGADGVDSLAEKWAKENNIKTSIYYADWSKGKKAGPTRNTLIVNECDYMIAFPSVESVGTYDSINKAKKSNKIIEVIEIIKFFKENELYGELSNFWKLETPIIYKKWKFETSEHLYHALKYIYKNAPKENKLIIDMISNCNTPYKSKLVANYCNEKIEHPKYIWQQDIYNKVKKIYDKGARINPNLNKLKIMRKTLIEKFAVSKKASKILLDTGDAILQESSIYDSFWGTGKDNSGENWLGILLMELRDKPN